MILNRWQWRHSGAAGTSLKTYCGTKFLFARTATLVSAPFWHCFVVVRGGSQSSIMRKCILCFCSLSSLPSRAVIRGETSSGALRSGSLPSSFGSSKNRVTAREKWSRKRQYVCASTHWSSKAEPRCFNKAIGRTTINENDSEINKKQKQKTPVLITNRQCAEEAQKIIWMKESLVMILLFFYAEVFFPLKQRRSDSGGGVRQRWRQWRPLAAAVGANSGSKLSRLPGCRKRVVRTRGDSWCHKQRGGRETSQEGGGGEMKERNRGKTRRDHFSQPYYQPRNTSEINASS